MRVKGSSASRNKLKKLFSITKGFWGRKKNVYRRAREAYLHALSKSYHDRKVKKRDFRQLWIIRINAAARENGLSYSVFMHGLTTAGVELDRKVLADMAVREKDSFQKLAELVKSKVA